MAAMQQNFDVKTDFVVCILGHALLSLHLLCSLHLNHCRINEHNITHSLILQRGTENCNYMQWKVAFLVVLEKL